METKHEHNLNMNSPTEFTENNTNHIGVVTDLGRGAEGHGPWSSGRPGLWSSGGPSIASAGAWYIWSPPKNLQGELEW